MFISLCTTIGRRRSRSGRLVGAAALAAIAGLLAAPSTGAAQPATASAELIPAALQPAAPSPSAAPLVTETPIAARIDAVGDELDGELLHGTLLRQFYATHDFQPIWAAHPAQAASLWQAVLRAGDHGLDPSLFHAALLTRAAALSPIDREILLSDAFLGFADALARGALPVERRMDDEDLTPPPIDVAAVLNQAIGNPDPAGVIEGLAPHSAAYLALQQALRTLRPEAGAGGVASANGAAASIREIDANLERLRWLPRNLPPDRVWVNTATTQLVLYRANQPIFEARVVSGEVDKQTPELQTTIESVLFNPPWNVPPSIAHAEILPKLAEDPRYLARHHMVWRSNGGIQQLAGPYSALGRVKFEMQDRFDVYLHDTPEKFLFARADRRRSHGCVRVQNAAGLAALLLNEAPETIEREIAVGYTHRQMLPAPIPVFVVYQTAIVDADGRIKFVPDTYRRDEEIWQHLNLGQSAPVAQHEAGEKRHG